MFEERRGSMSGKISALNKQIAEYASRLEGGDGDTVKNNEEPLTKRVKKRILQKLGKLKKVRGLSELLSRSYFDSLCCTVI